jgi:hypothetical protein
VNCAKLPGRLCPEKILDIEYSRLMLGLHGAAARARARGTPAPWSSDHGTFQLFDFCNLTLCHLQHQIHYRLFLRHANLYELHAAESSLS